MHTSQANPYNHWPIMLWAVNGSTNSYFKWKEIPSISEVTVYSETFNEFQSLKSVLRTDSKLCYTLFGEKSQRFFMLVLKNLCPLEKKVLKNLRYGLFEVLLGTTQNCATQISCSNMVTAQNGCVERTKKM